MKVCVAVHSQRKCTAQSWTGAWYCRLPRTCPGEETLSLAVAQQAQPSRSTRHQVSHFCLGKCDVICNTALLLLKCAGLQTPSLQCPSLLSSSHPRYAGALRVHDTCPSSEDRAACDAAGQVSATIKHARMLHTNFAHFVVSFHPSLPPPPGYFDTAGNWSRVSIPRSCRKQSIS